MLPRLEPPPPQAAQQQARKARRTWLLELHRQFVTALKVDGLTNDELTTQVADFTEFLLL